MITFNGISLDLPTIKITALKKDKAIYSSAMRRKTFYQKHELALLFIAVFLLTIFFYACLANNANLFWRLSTPVMKVLP